MDLSINNQTLILFTSIFPFGNGETFLEVEIQSLSKSFEKIIIVSADENSLTERKVPSNVSVIRKSFRLNNLEKVSSIFGLFSKTIIQEIKKSKSKFNFSNKSNLNYLLISYFKRIKISAFISSILSENNIKPENTFLYSYWWLDEAIGIAQFKKEHPEAIAFSRCHGYDVYLDRSKGNYLPLKNFSLKHLDHVFSISINAKEYIENHYIQKGNDQNKISVSRLGVNTGDLSLNKINPDTFLIVSCAHIYPNKRIDLILDAILKLNFKVKWVHLGSFIKGFSEDYYNPIIKKINNHTNQNIEIEFKGDLTNSEILAFYANNNVDLFINVSESEGVSVAIMEAMSFSIPVLATDVGGTSEIVNGQNGGLLHEKINSTDLSLKIAAFFDLNLSDTNNKRQAAFDTFNEKYNATTNYHSFVNDIKKLSEN